MPTAICPRCKATLKIKSTQGSFQCPKCGKELRVSSNKPKDEWWLKQLDEVLGPYTTSEIEQYIRELRIVRTSSLFHETETHSQWVVADQIKQFQSLFDETAPINKPPPVPPPVPKDSVAMGDFLDELEAMPVRLKRRSQASAWRFVCDFVDPTFKHYVTPTIIWITWWTILGSAALSFVLFLMSSLTWALDVPVADIENARFNQFNNDADNSESVVPQFVRRLTAIPILAVLQIVFLFLFLLWMRVVLELCIVVFHISDTLKSIHLHFNKSKGSA
jgi:Domain of unknown function (DUF4282)